MRKQRNIWQEWKRQGRQVALKVVPGALATALAIAMLGSMTSSHALAATTDTSKTYQIVSGDTLSGIASSYGISVDSLIEANHIANPDLIYAGETLVIPNGSSTSQATHKASSSALHGTYQDMIHQVFGQYGAGAVRVAMCESSMNPNAYNGVLGAAGLFQIIPGTFASTSYAGQSVYNPEVNIRAAHEIFVRDGYSWSEWACKP